MVVSADSLVHVVTQERSESTIDGHQRQNHVHSSDLQGNAGQGDGRREVVLESHRLELDILLFVSMNQLQGEDELPACRRDESSVAVHDLCYSVPLPLLVTTELRLQQLHKVTHLGLKGRLEDVTGRDGRSIVEHILTEVAPVGELKLARRIRGGGGGVGFHEEAGSRQRHPLPRGRLRELELTPSGDKAWRKKMVGKITTELRQVPSQVKQVIVEPFVLERLVEVMECKYIAGVLDRVNADNVFEVRFGPQREWAMAVFRVVCEEERTGLQVEGGEEGRGRRRGRRERIRGW